MIPAFAPRTLRGDALDAALHLGCGAAGEGEQHHPARIGAADDQMRDAMGERVGLARARAGDDEKRRRFIEGVAAVFDRAALFGVKTRQIAPDPRSIFCGPTCCCIRCLPQLPSV